MQNNILNLLKTNALFLLFCLIGGGRLAWAQEARPPLPQDTLPRLVNDTLLLPGDAIRLSKDSLDEEVTYGARDSIVLDNDLKKVFLFGGAHVEYTDISLKAAYIELDLENNEVYAEARPDSSGYPAGVPEFTQGEQVFQAQRMRYNFKTGKGIVYDVTTQQNDVVVHGGKTKFVGGDKKDSTSNDVLYSQDALFTTCNAEHPHFGIRSQKQKVVPDKLVIVGPSQLEIMDIPTPLWLPFGFFPINKSTRSTGLLFPKDYEYSNQWGFGLRDVGWFFPLGEHFNLALRSDIYLRGTWGVNASSDYRKRYKYSGNFRLGFDSRKVEDLQTGLFDRTKSVSINWSHRQEPAAHPSARFGGSINIQTNNYQNRVFNDAQNVLNSQLNSNMSFDKSWPGKPYNFSASFNHSQNRLTRAVTINFPDFRFLTQSLYPFKQKNRAGEEKWYETIVLRYSGEARNRFEATDTTLFTNATLDNARFGAKHDVSASTSFKVLKYFNLNPNVTYREVWQWSTIEKDFDPQPKVRVDTVYSPDRTQYQVKYDTLAFGSQFIDTLRGFRAFREFSTALSLNTRLFGTMNFGKNFFLRSIRHELRPSVSLIYSPNYLSPTLGYYDEVQRDYRDPNLLDRYSIFDGGIYGAPPASGQQMALGYSLNNIFQAKVQGRQDTVAKKIKLIDNLVVSGSYNFAADSLRFSPVSISTTARFFKGITTMGFFAVADPYITDANGRRINTTVWADRQRLLRLDNASIRFNSQLTVGKLRALLQGTEEKVVEKVNYNQPASSVPDDEEGEQPGETPKEPEETEADLWSLFENFSISHNIDFSWQTGTDGVARFRVGSNSLNCSGNIPLTKKWAITVGNFGYDFTNQGLSYPSFGIARDLHCWTMDFNWQPQRGTYSFNIRVKPGSLDFIKIPYQRNNADALRGAF
ncbi:MAG: hypothetical protein RL181_134 [Bacteroidota bacterium]|jgi:hypothetical protein